MMPHAAAHVFARHARFRPPAILLTVLAGWLWVCGPAACSARAQGEGEGEEPGIPGVGYSIPSIGYFAAFSPFFEGEYQDALKVFVSEGRGAIKTPQARWIDSICYETMVGECYYQMGHLDEALTHYTAAVSLYVAYADWMLRVQFPPIIRPSPTATRIPWGSSSRPSRRGHYPASMLIAQGRIDHNEQVKHGGVVQPAQLRPIQVQEIVRCTTLAIRRRTELMGPICQHDPLTAQLIARLSRRPGPPNHWSEAWIDLQLGLALVAGGKQTQALPHLNRAMVAAGEFDHPLTGIVLLELGRLQLAQGNYQAASRYFEEATYAAVHYSNAGVLEEAFRGGALAHLLDNRKGVYPPLGSAIRWAKVKNLRQLQASLLLLAAENYAVLGQTRDAAGLLEEARLAIGLRQMGAGQIGGRLQFLKALVLFQGKKITEGDAALAAAMDYTKRGSRWLLHISLVDGLYTGGAMTPRVAMDLYSNVLRDPLPSDWASDPMESLSVLVTPHPLAIEHWFEVALQRKEHEMALEIADRARRHRFFSTLAFGGRLQSLRWILEGPRAALDQKSLLHRQGLLAQYPAFDQLAQQARAIRGGLEAMPLVAADQVALKKQGQELARLAAVSSQQEAVLREMAVRREPAGLVFPPLRSTDSIQKSLPDGHALLAFFATRRHLYGFLLNNKRYAYWQVGSPEKLRKEMVELFRAMGHFEQNYELPLKDLTDNRWKESARQILELSLRGSQADFSQSFEELAIVPDGLLWYLPFEALQVSVDGRLRPLIARFRIRYAPTVSLAVPTGRGRNPTGNTAVVVGQLFPRADDAVARAAFDQLAGVVPGAVALKSPLPAPSEVYGSLFDRLIVLEDIDLSNGGPYGWAPVPIDQGKPGNLLGDWLRLPWRGPGEIILPGYHTAAEKSLKGVDPATAGREMFLSVCGLMSGGGRTLLVGRWRTGGQTSFDLVREFAQELPHTSPADAWQRAVFLTAGSRLNLEAEPRIKHAIADESPKANHPFFWAGYMLIDSGIPARQPAPEADDPALKLENPDQPQLRQGNPDRPDQPELKLDGPRRPAAVKR